MEWQRRLCDITERNRGPSPPRTQHGSTTIRRRDFLGRLAATAAVPLAARAALAAGKNKHDEPRKGNPKHASDRPQETHGGPLDLPPWSYGDSSAAPDTVLCFRGNPTRSFYGTGDIPDKPEILWKHRMKDFPASYYGKPHVWRGTGWTGQAVKLGKYVFIGSQGCHLYAFDADTGKVRWRFKGGRMFKSSACLYDNKLYIGNVDNFLRCIDAATGNVLWKLHYSRDLDSSACVTGGKLYIAGENGHARCIDPQTGELHWKTFVGGINRGSKGGSYGSETSPAVADGQFFTATYDGELFCLDAQTGAKKWVAKTGDDTDASPVIYKDRVYTAAEDKNPKIFCFDRETGKEVWSHHARGGVWATPALADETLYCGSFGGRFYCLDARDGKLKWETKIGSPSWSSPCVLGDKVVFGAFDGNLRCLDKATGKLLWKLQLRDRMHSTPCIVDGRIYIGTRAGWFYAIG